jgi:putative selenium metabolism protein SsnA
MTDSVLLGNGVVLGGAVTTHSFRPEVVRDGAVVWTGERIVAVGPEAEVRPEFPHARYLDARGGFVLPGMINLHHHFYSSLARGLDPRTEIADFTEILDRFWWRLDRALNADAIRVSAEVALADCIRSGCTTVFDHHASPSAIAGSLDIIAEAVEAYRLSAVLCYEVTDRNGHDGAIAGMEENLRFIEERRQHPRIRGTLGLHASFTLRDETLVQVADRCAGDVGCHIHVAEDPVDVRQSVALFGVGPVERLRAHGLLASRSLLAHGIHLEREDYQIIARHGAVVIHNPESNAHNGVGHLDVVNAAGEGCLVGLGTDGMSSSMLSALRSAFLMHRHELRDPRSGLAVLPDLLANNARVARRFFDEPRLGELAPGAPADIAVVDAPPPTTIDGDNAFAHLLYGVSEAPVRHTVARGRVLLEDFQHVTIDREELAARARSVAPRLWERFHTLQWGTRFLGS